MDLEQKFPLVTIRALSRTRAGSDHTPLLIDSGIKAHNGSQPRFSFEIFWLRQEGFYEMVAAEWTKVTEGRNPMERWQNKIGYLRHFLKGWAKT